MNRLIDQIMAESGDVRRPERFRRYLQSLTGPALQEKLADLQASRGRDGSAGQQARRPVRPAPAERPQPGTGVAWMGVQP